MKEYNARPEVKERRKVQRNTPEAKEMRKKRSKEYDSKPEVKAKKRISANRPENKARAKKHREKPEVKTKRKEYLQNYAARRKELDARPERKAKNKVYKSKPENKKRARELDRDLRYLVLQTYSKRLSDSKIPCCNCCHLNSNLAFLAVDHIAGKKQMDSEHELKKLGYSSKFQSWALLRWLKRKNFPEGFQILCHNCNHAKGHSTDNKCPLEGKPH